MNQEELNNLNNVLHTLNEYKYIHSSYHNMYLYIHENINGINGGPSIFHMNHEDTGITLFEKKINDWRDGVFALTKQPGNETHFNFLNDNIRLLDKILYSIDGFKAAKAAEAAVRAKELETSIPPWLAAFDNLSKEYIDSRAAELSKEEKRLK